MKTSVMDVRDMLSVLSVAGVEERIGEVPGVESVTVNSHELATRQRAHLWRFPIKLSAVAEGYLSRNRLARSTRLIISAAA